MKNSITLYDKPFETWTKITSLFQADVGDNPVFYSICYICQDTMDWTDMSKGYVEEIDLSHVPSSKQNEVKDDLLGMLRSLKHYSIEGVKIIC